MHAKKNFHWALTLAIHQLCTPVQPCAVIVVLISKGYTAISIVSAKFGPRSSHDHTELKIEVIEQSS